MKLSDLKPAEYNPRKISDKQLEMLKKALAEFGDLSGIVFNRRTGRLIGGHQRLKCLPPDAKIEKKDLKEPSKTGTVAHGFIIIDGEKYTYREVDWDEATEKMANIAANKHSGEFDNELLASLLKELSESPNFDIQLTGFIENPYEDQPEEKPELPITAKLYESYNYVLIYTINITDQVFLENLFDLQPRRSYKSQKISITRVIDFQTFMERIKNYKCES